LDEAAQSAGRQLARQTFKELGPEAVTELAFVLPDKFNLKSRKLKLQGHTRDLPIYSWELPAPRIERASWLVLWILAPLFLFILVALFYLRRYRHPLVVQLSEKPVSLLQLPPEQLEDARTRL
jgi:hypothetical protein